MNSLFEKVVDLKVNVERYKRLLNSNMVGIIEIILSMVSALALYWCFVPLSISSNDMIYAIGEIHMFNKDIFNFNVFMKEGVVSPRVLLDAIFSFLMKLNGGDWALAVVLLKYSGGLLFAFSVTVLVYHVTTSKRFAFTTIFVLYLIRNVVPQIGGFDTINVTSTIGMGIGYSFVILAIAFSVGENRKYNLMWLALALAAVFHIHEGLYGLAIVLICFLSEFFSNDCHICVWGGGETSLVLRILFYSGVCNCNT